MTDKAQSIDKALEEFNDEGTKLTAKSEVVGVGGVYGLEAEDLNIPYMYLVRGSAQFAVLEDGSKAPEGTFYHSTKKTAVKELEVIFGIAKKDTFEVQKDNKPVFNDDGSPKLETVWKTLMISTKNLYNPFSFSIKGMNYWIGLKDLFTTLQETNKLLNNVVIKITSEIKEMQTKEGLRRYPTTKFTVVRDVTDEEKEVAKSLESRFATKDLKDDYEA